MIGGLGMHMDCSDHNGELGDMGREASPGIVEV